MYAREETRKVRGGELLWGRFAVLLARYSVVLGHSQVFSVIPSQSRASQSSRGLVVSRPRRFTPFYKCNDAKSSTFCIITFIKTATF